MFGPGEGALIFLVGLPLLLLYFLPGVIAEARHHPNHWMIFGLNLILGWTVIGWIALLVWSLVSPSQGRTTAPHPTLGRALFGREMVCVQCGAAYPDKAEYCPACGAQIS